MGKYDDIIHLVRPKSDRPSMPVADRAKIFMPFAALKGYDDAIEETKKLTTQRIELTEEKKEELDRKLQRLNDMIALGEKPEVTITYFVVDKKVSLEEGEELGKYIDFSGAVTKVDLVFEQIRVMENIIHLSDVLEIEGEIFD